MATPMQQQYNQIKSEHPDEIVLFRLGDFYEAFNSDAETISRVLGITLTGRGKNETRIPMAGIPYHALANYLPKLIKAGYKAVVVEQKTEPKPGELVEREVAKIYTPGTLVEENVLSGNTNNYIVAIHYNTGKNATWGLAIADISTGKLEVCEFKDISGLLTEISRLQPAEILLQRGSPMELLEGLAKDKITFGEANKFSFDNAYSKATEQLGTTSLKGFGIEEMSGAIVALGALIDYLQICQKAAIAHMKSVNIYNYSQFMNLDHNTIRNLEIVAPMQGDDFKYTLYGVLNECYTNMGKRKLYDWILHPFVNSELLQLRLDITDYFFNNNLLNSQIREQLHQIYDLERILGRLGVGGGNARDMIALKDSLTSTVSLTDLLKQANDIPEGLKDLLTNLDKQTEIDTVINLINDSINPDAPPSLTEGSIIKTGFNIEVDELRGLSQGGKSVLAEIQQREVARTGITSLKVSYNKVFGYYIEITNSHLGKVPADYIRKQTLTNGERFITQELKEWEDKILTAESKLLQLEYELFSQIRDQIITNVGVLLQVADAIAQLDVLTNFAHIARQYNYIKPEITNDNQLEINDGRHPVVERLMNEFTPNDVEFNKDSLIIILTGPNMSGKSTYIRQVALITLMAQIGSFVPAKSMRFSLTDRIFTRVGASDNLSKGESTFMVEMHETANILNNATNKSLVILDEVGRGTSTYDGVAIAWSIVEYICEKIAAKTLFATHYHELISLSDKSPQIKNYHVKVIEDGDKILFQHRIAPGSTSRSYGVHVAEMAGVPKDVVTRAEEILSKFESGSDTSNAKLSEKPATKEKSKSPTRPKKIAPEQLGLI